MVLDFIKDTQPKEWAKLEALHGPKTGEQILTDLCKWMDANGSLATLRHGFKCYGRTLFVAYFKAAHELNPELEERYAKNRLGLTRQLRFSTRSEKSLDVCPAFMAVEGLRGRAGAAIDRLELFCQRLDRRVSVLETFLGAAGGSGGAAFRDRCAGRSAMVGLTYDTSWVLARLGGVCTELSRFCLGTTCLQFQRNGLTFALGSHGGGTDNAANEFSEQCGSNEGLVGINVRAGQYVDAVGGICANISSWTIPSSGPAPPTTDLPMRGGTGGGLSRLMCPRGELLTGWELRAGALIDRVQPVCRRFD